MGIVFQNTFDSDPGAWLTLQSGSGTNVWNPDQQAVELNQPNSSASRWRITSAPFLTEGEYEVDYEYVSSTASSGDRGIGIWLHGVSTGLPGILSTYWFGSVANNGRYHNNEYNSSEIIQQVLTATELEPYIPPTHKPGERRIRKAKFKRYNDIGVMRVQFFVETTLLCEFAVPTSRINQFTFGFWIGNLSTARIHSVTIRDDTDLDSVYPMVGDYLAEFFSVASPLPLNLDFSVGLTDGFSGKKFHRENPVIRMVPRLVDWQKFRIRGTTKLNLPPLVNVSARVLLFLNGSDSIVAETRSDATTGEYEFRHLSPDHRYTVVALYDNSTYRAVIADNIAPELVP